MKKRVSLADQLERLTAERAPYEREAFIAEVMNYAGTDLLCYRAPKTDKICNRQDQVFTPITSAITLALGIRMEVTDALAPIAQPTESLSRLEALLTQASDRELAGLYVLTPLLGSALLAVGLWKGLITLDQAIQAATLDEVFQAEQWGEDAEENAARAAKCEDLRVAVAFLAP